MSEIDSPYASLPTSWLQFRDETPAPQSISNGPTRRPNRVRLSHEAEERIKKYIRSKSKKGIVKWPETRDDTLEEAMKDEYYIPSVGTQNETGTGSSSSTAITTQSYFASVGKIAGNLLSRARNYTTDPPITREMLVLNKVSVYALILHCAMPMSELYAAGIIENVYDLNTLQFKAKDLVRTRELFGVNNLCMLFQVDQTGLREAKCKFGLRELYDCNFKQGELETLFVDIGVMIEEDGGEPKDLTKLNWDYTKLCGRGLTRAHLDILGLTREIALAPIPLGLGWSRSQYEKLPESNKK
jgi:hypothetical protein